MQPLVAEGCFSLQRHHAKNRPASEAPTRASSERCRCPRARRAPSPGRWATAGRFPRPSLDARLEPLQRLARQASCELTTLPWPSSCSWSAGSADPRVQPLVAEGCFSLQRHHAKNRPASEAPTRASSERCRCPRARRAPSPGRWATAGRFPRPSLDARLEPLQRLARQG